MELLEPWPTFVMLQSLTKILFVWVPLIQKGGLIQIKGKWKFVVMQGTKQENLYILQGSTMTGSISTLSQAENHSSNKNSLWHMRIDHMSDKWLEILSKKGYLEAIRRNLFSFMSIASLLEAT